MSSGIFRRPGVLIVDSDTLYAARLERSLHENAIRVVHRCEQLHRALELFERETTDVVVVDPHPWGAPAISRLTAALPVPVVVNSTGLCVARVLACLDAGAVGYLTKDEDATRLAQHVRDAVDGGAPFSADIGSLLLPILRDCPREAPGLVALTAREKHILGLLVQGHAYASIGIALGIGLGTVQSHIKNLYRKLEVCSKAEAVAMAMQHGLLRADSISRREGDALDSHDHGMPRVVGSR